MKKSEKEIKDKKSANSSEQENKPEDWQMSIDEFEKCGCMINGD